MSVAYIGFSGAQRFLTFVPTEKQTPQGQGLILFSLASETLPGIEETLSECLLSE